MHKAITCITNCIYFTTYHTYLFCLKWYCVLVTIWVFPWACSIEFYSCAYTVVTYVRSHSVCNLCMCLVLEVLYLYICPILTLILFRFALKFIGMLLRDITVQWISSDNASQGHARQHVNGTKQKYLPYSTHLLIILPLTLYCEQMMLLSI